MLNGSCTPEMGPFLASSLKVQGVGCWEEIWSRLERQARKFSPSFAQPHRALILGPDFGMGKGPGWGAGGRVFGKMSQRVPGQCQWGVEVPTLPPSHPDTPAK